MNKAKCWSKFRFGTLVFWMIGFVVIFVCAFIRVIVEENIPGIWKFVVIGILITNFVFVSSSIIIVNVVVGVLYHKYGNSKTPEAPSGPYGKA